MKKRFSLIFAMLIIVLAFGACGKDSSSSSASSSSEQSSSSIEESSSSDVLTEHTIVFITNGGSRVYNKTQMAGTTLEVDNPTYFGRKFAGWYLDEELTIPFDGIVPNEDITLYAKWTLSTVAINLVYNSPDYTDGVLEGQVYNTSLVLPTPTRPNAKFLGWYTDSEFINPCIMTQVPAAAITLYALWQFNENTTIYVSPTGSLSNSGTSTSSPLSVQGALYFGGPNVTIEVMKADYTFTLKLTLPVTASGSYGKMGKINGNGNIFNFDMNLDDSNRGLQINASYWYVKDLTIKGAGDNGILVGGNSNVVENCVFTENGDTGLQISRYSSTTQPDISTWPSNNIIRNCTSFNNTDLTGENADGFAAKLTVGYGNIFDGCIAYNNSDDGWDLYAKPETQSIGSVILINCVAFNNGRLTDNSAKIEGDGNGFKLGGSNIIGHVILENCVAFNNNLHGFTDNSNPGTIIIKNCTAFNNGITGGTKDNFNLARNANKANNCYYGLLSYSTDNDYSAINGDDFRGSIAYSILRVCLDNENIYTYAIGDYIEGNSTNENAIGTRNDSIVSESSFASIVMPDNQIDLHTALRNADGSVNLGDFLKVTDSTLLTYCEGNQVGANLSKSTMDDYDHYTQPDLSDCDTEADQILKIAYDSLYDPTNLEAVFKDINLAQVIYGVTITWTSSDSTLIDCANEYYPNMGVVYRGNEDKTCTLTATLTYTVDGNEYKTVKSFVCTLKTYIPGIGDIDGIDTSTQVFMIGEEYSEPDLIVYDRNSRGNEELVEGEDYSVSYAYFDKNGDSVDEVTAKAGTYTCEATISLIHFDEEITTSFNITVISDTDTLDIISYEANYIVGGKVDIDMTLSYHAGKVYVLAVPQGSAAPTASQVRAQKNYGSVVIAGKALVTVDSFNLTVAVEVGEATCVDLYFIAYNDNGASVLYSRTNVEGMVNISTTDDFIKMCTVQDATPKAYALTCDLDFTGVEWVQAADAYYFAGLFDGYGHTISNLTIVHKSLPGIFVNLKGGIVQNLTIENSSSTQTGLVQTKGAGMICGFMEGGTIQDCKLVNCSVSGYEGIGGFVGTINSGNVNIFRCSLINDTEHTISCTNRYAGGIVGGILNDNVGTIGQQITNIVDCIAITDIGPSQYLGGIVGRYKNAWLGNVELYITNCYYRGTITATKYSGGLCGGSDKEIGMAYFTNCFIYLTIFTSQSENRSVIGRTISDDYTILDNVASIGTYETGKDNAEYNLSYYQTLSSTFWSQNGFDMENVWSFSMETGLVLK